MSSTPASAVHRADPAPPATPPAPARLPFAWLPAPLRPGATAVRRFARPFLLIQGCALGIVVAFYAVPAVRGGLEALAAWKDRGGLPLATVLAAFAGGVLPELAKAVALRDWRFDRRRLGDLAFNTAFFALLAGVLTNLFYMLQARVWGHGTDWATVLKKVAVDQGLYTSLFTAPFSLVVYRWRANRYHVGRTLATLRPVRRMINDDLLPVLLPAWCYWTPIVLLVYSLPTPLQFVLFACALAAWSLILTFVAAPAAAAAPGGGVAPDA